MRRHDNALRRGNDTIVVGPAKAGLGFQPPLTTCSTTDRCSTITQICQHVGPLHRRPSAGQPSYAEYRATPTGSSSHHGHLLLREQALSCCADLLYHQMRLIAPIWPPTTGRVPHAKPASTIVGHASRAVPVSTAISRTSLCRGLASDPSSNRCRAGQMRLSATPPTSRSRPSCLLPSQPRSPPPCLLPLQPRSPQQPMLPSASHLLLPLLPPSPQAPRHCRRCDGLSRHEFTLLTLTLSPRTPQHRHRRKLAPHQICPQEGRIRPGRLPRLPKCGPADEKRAPPPPSLRPPTKAGGRSGGGEAEERGGGEGVAEARLPSHPRGGRQERWG
ncbi:hypothetical protein OsI_10431 [Oryza sativa Indica Group]|uniref:Uncharacterized protein n=1 Tax=Oryza sativa subsp. indica TaxID=39946 RepID=B8AQE9_ORYSI|nr:hypothetical protein OsI_10431 [Oryza sativa Indica Group]